MERNYARHRSYGNAFIALRGHYLTAGFYNLMENPRFYNIGFYSGSLCFGSRQNDFVTMSGRCLFIVAMSIVVMSIVVMSIVVCLLYTSDAADEP